MLEKKEFSILKSKLAEGRDNCATVRPPQRGVFITGCDEGARGAIKTMEFVNPSEFYLAQSVESCVDVGLLRVWCEEFYLDIILGFSKLFFISKQ